MLIAPLHGYITRHCEEPGCSVQTLEESSVIMGYRQCDYFHFFTIQTIMASVNEEQIITGYTTDGAFGWRAGWEVIGCLFT